MPDFDGDLKVSENDYLQMQADLATCISTVMNCRDYWHKKAEKYKRMYKKLKPMILEFKKKSEELEQKTEDLEDLIREFHPRLKDSGP